MAIIGNENISEESELTLSFLSLELNRTFAVDRVSEIG